LISRSFLFEGLELAGPSNRCRDQSTCEPPPAKRDDVPDQRGFADDVELSTQSGIVTSQTRNCEKHRSSRRRAATLTRAASATTEKGAGEIVVAGLEFTNSLIDR
jgi:hypothetical protein